MALFLGKKFLQVCIVMASRDRIPLISFFLCLQDSILSSTTFSAALFGLAFAMAVFTFITDSRAMKGLDRSVVTMMLK